MRSHRAVKNEIDSYRLAIAAWLTARLAMLLHRLYRGPRFRAERRYMAVLIVLN